MSDAQDRALRRWKAGLGNLPRVPRWRLLGGKSAAFFLGGLFVIATIWFLSPEAILTFYMVIFALFMTTLLIDLVRMKREHRAWNKEFDRQTRESHDAWMDYIAEAKKSLGDGEEWKR